MPRLLAIAVLVLGLAAALVGACRSRLPVDPLPRPDLPGAAAPAAPSLPPVPDASPSAPPAPPAVVAAPVLHVEYYQISDG